MVLNYEGITDIIVGDICMNNQGCLLEILNIRSKSEVKVIFLDKNQYTCVTSLESLRDGGVRNVYHRSVFGVGFIGDFSEGSDTEVYRIWQQMLRRCYSEEWLRKYKSYSGCTVCEEWHNLSNFNKWFINQKRKGKYKQGWQLDKDLVGNSKNYCPENCLFLPEEVNQSLVSFSKSKVIMKQKEGYCYYARIGGVEARSPKFPTKEEALDHYMTARSTNIQKLLDKYKIEVEL